MAKRRREARAEEVGEAVPVARVPRTPAGCRKYMRGELTKKFPSIVDGFVEAAKTGSCPHVKLATELLRDMKPKRVRRPAAVETLLQKMVE